MFDHDVQRLIEKQTGCPRSPYKIGFTGSVRKDTWQIRGLQIACARSNWKAIYEPAEAEDFDAYVVVKRPDHIIMDKIRRRGVPIIYDIIDGWAQPADEINNTNPWQIEELFKRKFQAIKPDSVIFPNARMREHLGHLVPHSTTIYHHYAPWLQPNPILEDIRTIGYSGDPRWLDTWADTIQWICDRHGWRFAINPADMTSIDVVVAVRGGVHDNRISQSYKSNVKLANAYGSGTPCAMQYAGISYRETASPHVRFFETDEELEARLMSLRPHVVRSTVSRSFLNEREKYSIATIANQYESYFAEVLR